VDAQSAGDWLAMLSQISAVTAYKTLSYDLLDLQPGERAVDVGCGLGDDARELARRVGPTGSVVGVDGSAEMIDRARAATDPQTARTLSFITGDAMDLPLEPQTFDALRADRLLQHVEDPLRALLGFRRALRPGGRLVLIEPDWKTMAVYPGSAAGGDDDTCVAAIFDWHVAHTSHPLIGRQLRMLLTQAGFINITVSPVAYASTHFIEADLTLELTRAATGAAEQWPSRLSAADAQAWRVTAQAAAAAGHFFASVPLFFAHATKG
jgi:ubiquinone/menaquinone biosynthesis C-methylase UbiE